MTLICDLDFQSRHTIVMQKGEKSVGSKDRLETDRRNDTTVCITLPANAVHTTYMYADTCTHILCDVDYLTNTAADICHYS